MHAMGSVLLSFPPQQQLDNRQFPVSCDAHPITLVKYVRYLVKFDLKF